MNQSKKRTVKLGNFARYYPLSKSEMMTIIPLGIVETMGTIAYAPISQDPVSCLGYSLIGIGATILSTGYIIRSHVILSGHLEKCETLGLDSILENYKITFEDMKHVDYVPLKEEMPLIAEYINDNYLTEEKKFKDTKKAVGEAVDRFISNEKRINFKSRVVVAPNIIEGNLHHTISETINGRIYLRAKKSIIAPHVLAHEHYHSLGVGLDDDGNSYIYNKIGGECEADIAAALSLINSDDRFLKQSSQIVIYERCKNFFGMEQSGLRNEIIKDLKETKARENSFLFRLKNGFNRIFSERDCIDLQIEKENICHIYDDPVARWIAAYRQKYNADFFMINR